jgi:hypothetical protein
MIIFGRGTRSPLVEGWRKGHSLQVLPFETFGPRWSGKVAGRFVRGVPVLPLAVSK